MDYQILARQLHLDLPNRVGKFSGLIGASLTDGLFLTLSWPVAILLPILVLVFGLSVGAYHWLPYTIVDKGISAHHALSFMQMLPFLIIAVALSSLSSGLGLLLAVGYILGDLLIAGNHFYGFHHHVATFWTLTHIVPAKLVSYICLVLLVLQIPLMARALAASLPNIPGLKSIHRSVLVTLIEAAVMAFMVYMWAMMTPMTTRSLWLWIGERYSLVTVPYYAYVVIPLLPVLAAVFVMIRGYLLHLAKNNDSVRANYLLLMGALITADENPSRFVLPRWAKSLASSLLIFLLISGLISHVWPTAAIIFVVIATAVVIRDFLLPKVPFWHVWAGFSNSGKMPLLLRWLVFVGASYLITRTILAMPGYAAWQNDAAGSFGVELNIIVIGLALGALLFPRVMQQSRNASSGTGAGTAHYVGVISMIILGGAMVTHPQLAQAYCVAPRCCFANNAIAALVVLGLITFGVSAFLLADVLTAFALRTVLAAAIDMIGGAVASVSQLFDIGTTVRELFALGKADDLAGIAVKAFKGGISKQITDELEAALKGPVDNLKQEFGDLKQGMSDVLGSYGAPEIKPYPIGAEGAGPSADPQPGQSGVIYNTPPDWNIGPTLNSTQPVQTMAGSQHGLLSSSSGPFTYTQIGQVGDPAARYIWTIDQRGINILPGNTSPDDSGQAVTLSHVSQQAMAGGTVWFGPDNTVTIILHQGPDFNFENNPAQLQAIAKAWESLGYKVIIQS